MENQKLINGYILVEFDRNHKLSEKLDLVAPERYKVYESDSDHEHDRYGVLTDRRAINPQAITVITGNELIQTGCRAFVHYGAYETALPYENYHMIKQDLVLFLLDPIRPMPNNYLGTQVVQPAKKTDWGFILSVETKLPVNVVVNHVPAGSDIKPGTEVVTIDHYQYNLKYKDEEMVKVRDHEIIATIQDGQVIPRHKYILAEYVEQELLELERENEKRKHMQEVAAQYKIHLSDKDKEACFKPVDLPKQVEARIISFGPKLSPIEAGFEPGDTIMVTRNRGLLLPDGKWIINLDAVLYQNA